MSLKSLAGVVALRLAAVGGGFPRGFLALPVLPMTRMVVVALIMSRFDSPK